METYYKFLGLLFLTIIITACSSPCLEDRESIPSSLLNSRYQKAVEDAKNPEPDEIKELFPINKKNEKLRKKTRGGKFLVSVISLISSEAYRKYYKEENLDEFKTYDYIWVTAEPELLEKIDSLDKKYKNKALKNRVKKLIGLSPDDNIDYVVQFWVSPKKLFRPSPDPNIEDKYAEINFPESVSEKHRKWINNLRSKEYYEGKDVKIESSDEIETNWKIPYPWTQLGYTYDWAKKTTENNYGLSEYIIKKDKRVKIGRVYTFKEYINYYLILRTNDRAKNKN